MRIAIAPAFVLLGSLSVLPLAAKAETAEARGDRHYLQRAASFAANGALDPEVIDAAVRAYEEALKQDPENVSLHFKLMEALYFQGFYTVDKKRLQRPIFDRVLELSQQALARVEERTGRHGELSRVSLERQAEILRQVPESAEAHFWVSAGWGLWGMTHSALAALRAGVIHKVRDHARLVVLIDDHFGDADGLRVLGRMHTRTPKVPFITGWIDRREGLRLLRRALAVTREDPQILFFLAEAILDYEKSNRAEAIELLRELGRRQPRSHLLYEDSEVLGEAQELLAEEMENGRG